MEKFRAHTDATGMAALSCEGEGSEIAFGGVPAILDYAAENPELTQRIIDELLARDGGFQLAKEDETGWRVLHRDGTETGIASSEADAWKLAAEEAVCRYEKHAEEVNQFIEQRRNASRPWLCGVENVTKDGEGYVYYKGHHVEHFSRMEQAEMRRQAEKFSLICQRLERQGRPVDFIEYLASYDELKDFPVQKYFVTAPSDPRHGAQTRYDSSVVRVHPYLNCGELAEALKSYVSNWEESPFKTVEELRNLYCSDATWSRAKGMDANNPVDRLSIIEACSCNELVAAAIINAAKTGQEQNIAGGRTGLVEWIVNNHLRGKFEFEYIESLEDAERATLKHSDPEVTQHVHLRIYPNIAMAVTAIMGEGKLMRELDIVKSFAAAEPVPEPKPEVISLDAQAESTVAP